MIIELDYRTLQP